MVERSVNPNRLGKKSKDVIFKKFRRVLQVPLETEQDLFEYLQSVGIKTKKKKPDTIAKALWKKAGNIYNNLLQGEREAEAKRIQKRNAKEAKFVKDVIDYVKKPTTSQRTFTLPRDIVMERILRKLINHSGKIMMRVGAVSYPLNKTFIEKMIRGIANGEWLVENVDNYVRVSDEQAVYDLMTSSTFTIIILDEGLAKSKKKGAFFQYTHLVEGLDLTPYQIKYNGVPYKNFDESCFIEAITEWAMKNTFPDADAKIARIKSKMITRVMTAQQVKTIAEELGVSISIKDERDVKGNNKTRTDIKNAGCERTIPLGLVDNHYFLIEKVPITKYALIHHKELKDIDRWNEVGKIRNNLPRRDKSRFITSYDVISYMFQHKEDYLVPLSPNEMLGTIHYDTSKSIGVYEPNEKDTKPVEYKPRDSEEITKTLTHSTKFGEVKEVCGEEEVCYFDFESTTDRGDADTPNPHKAYLVVFKSETMSATKCIEGVFCGKRMLQEVARHHQYRPMRFIAHNVKYDFQFLYEHLHQVSKIQRGSMLLNARGYFYVDGYKVKFNFVDSYSFIATKLSAFPKMFGFQGVKEIMPYKLWNSKTIPLRCVRVKDTRAYCDEQIVSMNIGKVVSVEEKNEYFQSFVEKAKEWDCYIKDTIEGNDLIDIINYSRKYCEVDVLILQKGYETFKKWIKEVCELDINNYITLPSVADAYMKKSEVYEDCFEISGSQLLFIQKSMVGGRTMTRNNEMYNFTGENAILLDDLDAVSLYPSAMKRMGGYLKGTPKVLGDRSYTFLKSVDGYFVEIEITSVGKRRHFPLMSYITDTGVRLWTNEMVGKTIHVDKYALEDLIKFHHIKFIIKQGYYYDEGRNCKIGEVINHLFQTRLKKKKEGNGIEQIYKLLMNSAYGRTLLKPFEDEKVYKSENQYEPYVVRHYDSIKKTQPLHDNSYEITQVKPIINHYNLAHIGVEVLSMSKRIMNEVMCLAEDIGVEIYYQDTDSTHTPVADIPRLCEAYYKEYGRVLEGNEMGQFNCDFDSKKLKGKIRSVESVFLGKKCYVDKLKGDEEGVYDYHIRMKGVSGDAISDKLLEEGIDPIELYDRLHSGEVITFDLACRGVKACFETMADGTMTTRDVFKREICFGEKEV